MTCWRNCDETTLAIVSVPLQVPGANQAQENNGGVVASQYQGLGFKLLLLHTSHGQANWVYKLWQSMLDKILSYKDLYV